MWTETIKWKIYRFLFTFFYKKCIDMWLNVIYMKDQIDKYKWIKTTNRYWCHCYRDELQRCSICIDKDY